jgi:hypothetical protein
MLKAAREKCHITYKSKPMSVSADFSTEILKPRRSRGDIFYTMKENN